MKIVELLESVDRCTTVTANALFTHFGLETSSTKMLTGVDLSHELKSKGLTLQPVPLPDDLRGYTVKQAKEKFSTGAYYLFGGQHAMALIDGKLYDAANGTDRRRVNVLKVTKQVNERAELPKHTTFVVHKLSELKSSLWEHELSNKQIQACLNSAFAALMVKFTVVDAPWKQSQYTEAGLDGAQYEHDGWITVLLTDDIQDVLDGSSSVQYEDFANLCAASISHELRHRDQILKHSANALNAKDPEQLRDYLADHREIDAFAVQCAIELMSFWDANDIIMKMKQTRDLEHLAKWSDVLKMYLRMFDTSSVTRRLLKKLHSILMNFEGF